MSVCLCVCVCVCACECLFVICFDECMHTVKRRAMVNRLNKLAKTVQILQDHIKDLANWILADIDDDDENDSEQHYL